ncbi:IQ motif and ubiquitin-like domain-containing protein isoform X2 [Lineus longissimus]|uniref:IQ motif and ubiquitin-like domain-containing protein isoform X2 n=1 Tax=Lineus longissimus TaxID=88925 RepID=UPI00315D0157
MSEKDGESPQPQTEEQESETVQPVQEATNGEGEGAGEQEADGVAEEQPAETTEEAVNGGEELEASGEAEEQPAETTEEAVNGGQEQEASGEAGEQPTETTDEAAIVEEEQEAAGEAERQPAETTEDAVNAEQEDTAKETEAAAETQEVTEGEQEAVEETGETQEAAEATEEAGEASEAVEGEQETQEAAGETEEVTEAQEAGGQEVAETQEVNEAEQEAQTEEATGDEQAAAETEAPAEGGEEPTQETQDAEQEGSVKAEEETVAVEGQEVKEVSEKGEEAAVEVAAEGEGEAQAEEGKVTAEVEQPADGEDAGEQAVAGQDDTAEEVKEEQAGGEEAKDEQGEVKDEVQAEEAPKEDGAAETVEVPTEDGAAEAETKPDPEQEAAAPAEPAEAEKAATPIPATEDVGSATEPTKEVPEVDPHAASPRDTGAASPGSKVNLDATATVKFVLMPSGQVATLACTLGQTLRELKDHFATELKMSSSVLLLIFEGRNISNTMRLADLGVGPNGTIQLELSSVDPVNSPLKQYRPRQEYHMPDVISVKVQGDDGEYKDVVVEIERSVRKKPYLGGYRHKKTSVEFHHASAQTMAKPRPSNNLERNCRDTQTVQQRHRVQQTKSDTSTQMTKIGVYVSNMEDKLVIPGKYITADQRRAEKLANIITIQKYYRRWLAIRSVEKIREDRDKRLEWEKEEEMRKKKEKEDRIKREFERRMNPKAKEDFDLLYHALEKWRQEELDHINSTLSGAERKAALCQLLEQETQLISSIGRHKLEADNENKQKRIQSFLDKAAAPKRWRGHDGKMTEMDTPYTIRAQELRDIYATTSMRYLTQDERLDVLLTLKHTVKEHDCKLTQEIIELIDREADLLMRGVKETNLEGLRKRISTLFLQYIKTPMFNPEVTSLLKVPQDPAVLRKNIYFCQSCNQYLPSTDFQLSSNARTVGKCAKCNKKDNDARVRQDYSHYRFMLKALRKSEEGYDDDSKIAFLLQEGDLRYLVENVWSSQSVLSAWDDLYDLVLVRWDRNEEWSPWNCILLTKEEASAHTKLENLEEGYGKVFIHKVDHKHTLAKNYFARVPGMAQLMKTKEPKNPNSRMPTISGKKLSVQASA